MKVGPDGKSVGYKRGRARRRSVGALLATVAAVCGIVGYLIAPTRSVDAKPSTLEHSASSATISLEYPSGFRLARAPRGVHLSDPVALARSGITGGTVAAGRTAATGPTLLPADLRSKLPRRPTAERVRLGTLEALRYDDLRPAGSDVALRIYAAATTAGVAHVVCAASPPASRAFGATCERIAQTLRIRDAHGLPAGPGAQYATGLDRALREVNSGRAAAVARMRGRSPSAQAAAARTAAGVYGGAATNLAGMTVSPYDERAHAALASDLTRAQHAYERLASAAHAGDRSRYGDARISVGAAERAVKRAINHFGGLGYVVAR